MLQLFRQERELHNHQTWLKLAIILAVILLSFLLGNRASMTMVVLLAALVGGTISIAVLTDRPMLGLVALVLVTYFGRIVIPTGTGVSMNLTIVLGLFLVCLWLLHMFVLDKAVVFAPSRVTIPAIAFIVVTSLSLLAGNIRWVLFAEEGASSLAQFGAWSLYVLPIGIMLLIGNQLKDLRWLRRLTWLILAIGAFYIASRFFGARFVTDYIFIPGRNLGSVFWIFLSAIAFGQFFINKDLSVRRRALLALLVAMTFYVSLKQSVRWHSGWLPPLIGIFFTIWFSTTRWRVALTIIGLILLPLTFSDLVSDLLELKEEYTVYSRLGTYPIMFELIKANPILGLGPANYKHFTNLYPLLGYYVYFNSHSNYVDILAQTGLVGLGMFLWLAYELIRLALRQLRLAKDGFSRAYVCSVLGGLFGMLFSGLLGDWFLPFIYNIGTMGFRGSVFGWIFLGGLLALEQINRRQDGDLQHDHQPSA